MTSKRLLIQLKPLEPWFFGGENAYGGVNEQGQTKLKYYLTSQTTPSQTTLFGALRYLGLSDQEREDGKPGNNSAVGQSSFKLVLGEKTSASQCREEGSDSSQGEEKHDSQKFGKIISISPLYLQNEKGQLYIRKPINGNIDHHMCVSARTLTSGGDRHLPRTQDEYNEKDGPASGWVALCPGTDPPTFADYYDEEKPKEPPAYESVLHVGVNRAKDQKGFFKRELYFTKNNIRFAFFADVEPGFLLDDNGNVKPEVPKVVFLGQKRSAFSVTVRPAPEGYETDGALGEKLAGSSDLNDLLDAGYVYVQSDFFIPCDRLRDQLYQLCHFVCVQTSQLRVFTTDYSAGVGDHQSRYAKGRTLARLIRAGSVFWPKNLAEFVEKVRAINDMTDATTAGFNNLLYRAEFFPSHHFPLSRAAVRVLLARYPYRPEDRVLIIKKETPKEDAK